MRCGLCGETKRILEVRNIGNGITCHQLECGHQWHTSMSGDRTIGECDCHGYSRPKPKLR